MPDLNDLLSDLAAENQSLDDVLAPLEAQDWEKPSSAKGWTITDVVSHLTYFDEAAVLAMTDPEAFAAHKAGLVEQMAVGQAVDTAIGRELNDPTALLERWRRTRHGYIEAAGAKREGRVEWYGPPMSLNSFTTARIMEAWAHGVDIREGVDAPLRASRRLKHIIHIGVGARRYSFAVHGQEDPGDPVYVAAAAPDATTWEWGDPTAPNRVTGPALDLALVLAQRRHLSRTTVRVEGPVAEQWMSIAQAFAGGPTITAPSR